MWYKWITIYSGFWTNLLSETIRTKTTYCTYILHTWSLSYEIFCKLPLCLVSEEAKRKKIPRKQFDFSIEKLLSHVGPACVVYHSWRHATGSNHFLLLIKIISWSKFQPRMRLCVCVCLYKVNTLCVTKPPHPTP